MFTLVILNVTETLLYSKQKFYLCFVDKCIKQFLYHK